MTKEIKEYTVFLNNLPETCEREKIKSELLTRIDFYRHERLIHLLVTLFFGFLTFASFAASVCFENYPAFLALSALCLILLAPYIGHYYFLENSVQALYKIYYRISKDI